MARQRAVQHILGMARDNALSRNSNQLSYENRNVRVTSTENDHTLTAITNEKGTEDIGVDIIGTPNGTFVCNDYFGVFSHTDTSCYITIYQRQNGEYRQIFRYTDLNGEFAFGNNFIEAIVSVESNESVRVYWIDGEHEMRVIDFKKLITKYGNNITSNDKHISYFSYLPTIERVDVVSVDKTSAGYFYSGTVQFVITELINGNESNIVYYSPLYYVSDDAKERGFAPDNTSNGIGFNVQFKLHNTIDSEVVQFYVYCIYRSGKDGNANVFVREVTNTNVLMSAVFTGEERTVDSSYLIFKNSTKIKGIKTFAQKDNTLFIGNYETSNYDADIATKATVTAVTTGVRDRLDLGVFNGSSYSHKSQLSYNSYQIGHFKKGETYILGHQLLDHNGTWSEPIFDSIKEMTDYVAITNLTFRLPCFQATITDNSNNEYIAARPVIAYVSDARKRCLYQGFVTPSIFCEQERKNNICYAKSSPFARTTKTPRYANGKILNPSLRQNVNPPFVRGEEHHYPIYSHVYGALWGNTTATKVGAMQTAINKSLKYYANESSDNIACFTWLDYGSTHVLAQANDSCIVTSMKEGTYPASQHFEGLGVSHDYNCEIQNYIHHTDVVFKSAIYPVQKEIGVAFDNIGHDDEEMTQNWFDLNTNNDIYNVDNTKYYVDAHIVSFYSPDITLFNSSIDSDSRLFVVGAAVMNGFASDTQIVAQTPWLYQDGTGGFIKPEVSNTTTGRCAMTLPMWCAAWRENGEQTDQPNDSDYLNGSNNKLYWAISPFHTEILSPRNNQKNLTDEVGKLTYKQLSNYRFSNITDYNNINKEIGGTDSNIQYISGEQGSLTRFTDGWYKGAEDIVINASATQYVSNGNCFFDDTSNDTNTFQLSCKRLGAPFISVVKNKDMYGSMFCASSTLKAFTMSPYQNVLVTLHGIQAGRYTSKVYNRGVRYKCTWFRNTVTNDNSLLGLSSDSSFYGDIINNGERDQYENNYVDWLRNKSTLAETDNSIYAGMSLEVYNSSTDLWGNGNNFDPDDMPTSAIVNMKYLSSPHLAIDLGSTDGMKKILPNYGQLLSFEKQQTDGYARGYLSLDHQKLNGNTITDTWAAACPYEIDNVMTSVGTIGIDADMLWVVDIVNKDYDTIVYNEDTDYNALTPWYIAGEPVWFEDGTTQQMRWVQGNWYFQRWECLRTYAESIEDKNQVVEILSVMLETRTNIDGRYDANRGIAMLNANRENFGLINESYSQQNNFFSYYRTSLKENNQTKTYPNTIAWSLPKTLNSEVDSWTAITGQSYMDLDGDKGEVIKLTRFRNELFSFQPKGIARILYNSRTQLATEEGMPIEIANSGNVEGKLYMSNMIGAQDKRQVLTTDAGIYFADQYNKSLMLFTETAQSISEQLGFHSWAMQNSSERLWHMWDARHKSVLIVNLGEALSFNETLKHYESFFDYGDTFDIMNVLDDTLLLHTNQNDEWRVWRMNGGKYNDFFGVPKSWYVKYAVSTQYSDGQNSVDKPNDKIWDNVEYRGDMYDTENGNKFLAVKSPYNTIQAETEYQDSGENELVFKKDFHQNISNIKQKFRIWHGIIPRDAKECKIGRIQNRIRNPWVYLTMKHDIEKEENKYLKSVVQDFYCYYYE